MRVEYEQTWCDYLTKCQHFENIEVGSYDCYQCEHFCGFFNLKDKKFVECNCQTLNNLNNE